MKFTNLALGFNKTAFHLRHMKKPSIDVLRVHPFGIERQ
jgi:hypothetical protein